MAMLSVAVRFNSQDVYASTSFEGMDPVKVKADKANQKQVAMKKKDVQGMFELFDSDEKGSLGNEELKAIFQRLGMPIKQKELDEFTSGLKGGDDGKELDPDCFAALVKLICPGDFTLDDLRAAYQKFDPHDNGFITKQDLRKMLRIWSRDARDDELDEMMADADLNHDGVIDFQEFVIAICAQ